MSGLRVILVSVDYDDLLDITLPYNRHHFDEVMVVTAPKKPDVAVAKKHGAEVFVTDAFYRNDAVFNKWLALEEGLDEFGRDGWLCIMDADVLWPKDVNLCSCTPGYLYTPLRRMVPIGSGGLNIENCWRNINHFSIHRNVAEWAGYSQIFHGSDPVLGDPPWHETNWIHAGGADSFFQAKWPKERKVRPPFEVLHLGTAGENWFGRASVRLDGEIPEESSIRRKQCSDIWIRRRSNRATGLDPYTGERLG